MDEKKGNKIIISIVIILILCIGALVVYFISSNKEDVNIFDNGGRKSNTSSYDEEYYELDTVEIEQINKQEYINRIKKYNAVCGANDVMDRNTNELFDCTNSNEDEVYVGYINDGIPHYITNSKICTGEDCEIDEEHYDVYKFSKINDAKNIITRINQFNNIEFAYETESGEVYYFNQLYDEITIEDETHLTRLIKIDLPSELEKFSNIDNNGLLFSTEIVLELKNGKKYVLSYNQEEDKDSLTTLDKYLSE